MENKDFRERLRSGQAEFSPEKWRKMEQMLDSSESKSRGAFWLRWLGLGIPILLFLVIMLYNVKDNGFLESSKIETEELTQINKKNELGTPSVDASSNNFEDNIVDGDEFSADTEMTSITAESEEVNVTSTTNNRVAVETESKIDQSNTQIVSIEKETLKVKKSYIEHRNHVDKGNYRSESGIASELTKEFYAGNQNNVNKENRVKTLEELNSKNVLENKMDLQDEIDAIPLLDQYVEYVPESNEKIINNISENTEIKRLAEPFTGRYLFAQAGPGYFNGNLGMHLGAGVQWDLNKILGVETELGYSYGSDSSNFSEDQSERESQVELNVLFKLYLIRI